MYKRQGLGLAIAREIVVAHHGDIEAASERGVTVFTLRIPTQGEEIEGAAAAPRIPGAVSYTHLDVYKRQLQYLIDAIAHVAGKGVKVCGKRVVFHKCHGTKVS